MVRHFTQIIKRLQYEKTHFETYRATIYDAEVLAGQGSHVEAYTPEFAPLELTPVRRLFGGNIEYADKQGKKWYSSYPVILRVAVSRPVELVAEVA